MDDDSRALRPHSLPLTLLGYLALLAILVGAAMVASYTQRGFGTVAVSNAWFENETGIPVRAKRFVPKGVTRAKPAPGVVYIHGYQNNRETSDPFCIELARRGVVVLGIDAIGRGNSGRPLSLKDPKFDHTYGAKASVAYLKSLDYVDPERIGIMGHSMGASFAYETALSDSTMRALVISGFAFDERASFTSPKNMLMIFGIYDEFRDRMTHTADVRTEWMQTDEVKRAIAERDPAAGRTYGDFRSGRARQVLLPPVSHLQVTHDQASIAAALSWTRHALQLDEARWIDASKQIWIIKEVATLIALIAALFSAMPLGLLLLRWRPFSSLTGPVSFSHTVSNRALLKPLAVNGALMWLYLPLCCMIYAVHVHVIELDRPFPMMIVNSIVWWFFVINLIGFFLFSRWHKRLSPSRGETLAHLGIPELGGRLGLLTAQVGKAFLLGALLFAAVYTGEHMVELLFIVDLRFVFPFASDLTLDRALIFPRYFPFILFGFLVTGLFLHVQLRRPPRRTWWTTWLGWSLFNTAALVLPLVLFLAVQYGPLALAGVVPMVGPGGAFASFTMNLFHIVGVLLLVVPISTWFFQMTGKPYVGAVLTAAIVTWMLVSSQVIAPVPI